MPLEPDERILEVTHPSAFWSVLILFIFGTGLPFLFLVALVVWWAKHQHRYAVTNKRILVRTGVFDKRGMQIRRERITDVTVIRPFLVWLWHNGQVKISTAGGPGAQVAIHGQPNPDRLANAIRYG